MHPPDHVTPANTVTDAEALEILAAERRAMEVHEEREAAEVSPTSSPGTLPSR